MKGVSMRKDNYLVQAWTADWKDGDTFPSIFKGTEQECMDVCRKIFAEAASLLVPNDDDKYELSLDFDPCCRPMRVVEITLRGREQYEGLSYTRYYSIEYDWFSR